jgi:hypothetical protein
MRGRLLLVSSIALAALVGASQPAAQLEAPATALCPRFNASFYVEVGGSGSFVETSVYTGGAPLSRGGQIQYAWVTNDTGKIDRACKRLPGGSTASSSALRRPASVKAGDFDHERYECNVRGRLVIRVQKVRNGHQLTIRLQGGKRFLVSSVVTARGGSLRASKACLRNPP